MISKRHVLAHKVETLKYENNFRYKYHSNPNSFQKLILFLTYYLKIRGIANNHIELWTEL